MKSEHAWAAAATPLSLFLVGTWLAGCLPTEEGLVTCGGEICDLGEECRQAGHVAYCECPEGVICGDCPSGYRRTSDGCEQIVVPCPEGYERTSGGCQEIPEPCPEGFERTESGCQAVCTGDEMCGHGTCAMSSEGRFCACEDGYAGRLCTDCAVQFQDDDADGFCYPNCSAAALDCVSPRRCSTADGIASCDCPTGFTGEDCELCASGYRSNGSTCVELCATKRLACGSRRTCVDIGTEAHCECVAPFTGPDCLGCAPGYAADPATGACYPDCSSEGLDCGSHGTCADDVGFAYCHCSDGFTGLRCDVCQTGFRLEEDTCVFDIPPTHTVLTYLRVDGLTLLAAVDPSTGEFVQVRRADPAPLAQDVANEAMYSVEGDQVVMLDVVAGTSSNVSRIPQIQAALAFDSTRGRLLALEAAPPHALLSIELENGFSSQVGDTALSGVRDLEYLEISDEVLVLADQLVGLQADTGEASLRGAAPAATQGLAVDGEGRLLALAATDLPSNEARIEACRLSAAALGLRGYERAPGRAVTPGPEDRSLSFSTADTEGEEVVAYRGVGVAAGPREVAVAAANPDAVVCLEVWEATALTVTAAAQFRALVVLSEAQPLAVDIETGFAAEAEPALHLYASGQSISIPPDADTLIRVYEDTEWRALGAALDPEFFTPGPGVIHTLDPATGESLGTVGLARGAVPVGPAARWVTRGEDPDAD